jgi:hypothetical protein
VSPYPPPRRSSEPVYLAATPHALPPRSPPPHLGAKPRHASGFPCRPCKLQFVKLFSDNCVFSDSNGRRYCYRHFWKPRHAKLAKLAAKEPFSLADPADFTLSVVLPSSPASIRRKFRSSRLTFTPHSSRCRPLCLHSVSNP